MSSNSSATDDDPPTPPPAPRMARAVRLHYGRGGRIHIDLILTLDVDEDPEGERRRLQERWKFDADDAPPVGPDGSEEEDRTLVDDYDNMYLRHTMTLFSAMDHANLLTDPIFVIQGAEGGSQIFLRDASTTYDVARCSRHLSSFPTNDEWDSTYWRRVQMRIFSNGGMRPPMAPVSNLQSTPHQMSPPQTLPVPIAQHSSSANVAYTTAPPAIPNGIAVATLPQPDANGSGNVDITVNSSSPISKPQNPTTPQPQPQQHFGTTNGYHLTPLASAYSHSQSPPQLSNISNGGSGLSQQQMRDLKSAFANMPAPELGALQNVGRALPGPYMHMGPKGANMNGIQLLLGTNIGNLKLSPVAAAAARQMQWGALASANGPGSPITQMQQIQRPGPVVNGNHMMDGQLAVNGGNALPSPNLGITGLPVRSPSENGMRSAIRNEMLVNGPSHSMSPLMRHSPSPLPNMAIVGSSPPHQHQQPLQTQSIGSTLNGY
ncbi:hypothetical protein BYT27DRAFT_7339296 [Phlegmacium glaucopus]|nr:hypothetical protein BYT27DRAFT_7339296 [Phlegmacium glaucopus]